MFNLKCRQSDIVVIDDWRQFTANVVDTGANLPLCHPDIGKDAVKDTVIGVNRRKIRLTECNAKCRYLKNDLCPNL
jgi:hypothetical protein